MNLPESTTVQMERCQEHSIAIRRNGINPFLINRGEHFGGARLVRIIWTDEMLEDSISDFDFNSTHSAWRYVFA
jgi:hypothetical protein